MSLIGPRPLLVRYLPRYNAFQKHRHDVRPGLTGWAQVNGRNSISWEEKLEWDLKYIKKITFLGDVKIIMDTVLKAFVKKEGINREGTVSDMDFGDWLLSEGKISQEKYREKQAEAKKLLA